MAATLGAASLVRLTGADAIAFAHAQFSSDIQALAPGHCGWSAWLDAQGRVRAVFALLRVDETTLLLWLPLGDAASLAGELTRYRLRSRVQIEPLAGWQVRGLTGDAVPVDPARWHPQGGGHALRLPVEPARGVALLPGNAAIDAAAAIDWRHLDITARLPWLGPACAGRFVPQALELERIGALSFDKGCYPGQEIAARLHFRGGNKRGLRAIATGTALPDAGAALLDDGGGRLGEVLYAAPPRARQPARALLVSDIRPAPEPPDAAADRR